MPCLVDLEVFDEPFVLRLADLLVAADASQVIDKDFLTLLDEEVLPEVLDEGVAEKLHPQRVVVLFEDEEQWVLLHGSVRRPLDAAREEDDEHLLDAFLVKETFWHLYVLTQKFGNLLNVVRIAPALEPLLIVILFKLLA